MPCYQYYCRNCGKYFTQYRRIEDRSNAPCDCGALAKKLISVPGFARDSSIKDGKGNPIWFPKDNISGYYDKALCQHFRDKKHKQEWMKETNTIMDGSADKSNRHRDERAGSTKYDSRRVK